jgi:hypothetical protein
MTPYFLFNEVPVSPLHTTTKKEIWWIEVRWPRRPSHRSVSSNPSSFLMFVHTFRSRYADMLKCLAMLQQHWSSCCTRRILWIQGWFTFQNISVIRSRYLSLDNTPSNLVVAHYCAPHVTIKPLLKKSLHIHHVPIILLVDDTGLQLRVIKYIINK